MTLPKLLRRQVSQHMVSGNKGWFPIKTVTYRYGCQRDIQWFLVQRLHCPWGYREEQNAKHPRCLDLIFERRFWKRITEYIRTPASMLPLGSNLACSASSISWQPIPSPSISHSRRNVNATLHTWWVNTTHNHVS